MDDDPDALEMAIRLAQDLLAGHGNEQFLRQYLSNSELESP